MGLRDEYEKIKESLTNIERKMDELTITRMKLNKTKQGYIYQINALVQACNQAKEDELLKIYIQHYHDIDKCGIDDTIEFKISHYMNEYDRVWGEEKDLLLQLEAMKREQFTKMRKYSSKEDPSDVVAGLLYTGSEETVKAIAEFGNDILDVNSTYIIIKNEDKEPFVFNINTMVYRYNNGKNNIIQSMCFESFLNEFEATD